MSLNQNNVTHHPKRLTIGPRASFESSYEMEWNGMIVKKWNGTYLCKRNEWKRNECNGIK